MCGPKDCPQKVFRSGMLTTTTGEWLMGPALVSTRADLPLRELLHLMALSREGDRREGILLRQGKGWFQVSGMGHEALAAIAYHLTPNDYLFPYYRDRALVLAR